MRVAVWQEDWKAKAEQEKNYVVRQAGSQLELQRYLKIGVGKGLTPQI